MLFLAQDFHKLLVTFYFLELLHCVEAPGSISASNEYEPLALKLIWAELRP